MEKEVYLTLKYNSKARWLSYWYQVSGTLEVSPRSVLIVGKGSGIVEGSIRQLSNGRIEIKTLDINPALNPDIIGNVTNIPFGDGSFDVGICCQVLEHLSFDKFGVALGELHRVIRSRVILSLPHKRKHLKIAIKAPFIGEKTIIIKHPLTVKHCTSKQHYWEIARGVTKRQVVKEIKRFFDIEKEFLNEINCEHRFFILKKRED
ncbi:MAG: hypothetical protein Fur0020_04350 [Thermodesulfovibrionia bacterium]